MATSLIQLQDGTLVEAEVPEDRAQYVSGGEAEKVQASLGKVQELLVAVGSEISAAWRALEDPALEATGIQVQVAVGFEGEGNVYIAKARGSANLTVTLSFSRKS